MKRVLIAAAAVILGASVLFAGCGQKKTASSPSAVSGAVGNTDTFNMTEDTLSVTLNGVWVNQSDSGDKLTFESGLSFTHQTGEDVHAGSASLNPSNGILTISYEDGFRPEKGYIWVDSLQNAGANTWYIDGGTFAFGGAVYIRGAAE